MQSPQVSIQIVNYQTSRFLELCLRTVVADVEASGIGYEINILDNASEDLDAVVRPYSRCNLHCADRNCGFGAGHNRLATSAEAPYLLILNPDIQVISPGTIERLLASIQAPGVGIVGPRLADAAGRTQRWDHGRLHGLRAQISNRAGHSYWSETSNTLEVAWVSGAAMLVVRELYASLGGFDESFFLYKEDEDLCLRARGVGSMVLYNPHVTLFHHGSAVARRRDELKKSSDYFIQKHFRHRALERRSMAALHKALPYLRL